MKILFLNESPKNSVNVSELLINGLCQRLGNSNEYLNLKAIKIKKQELLDTIKSIDTIVIAFPLYVDGIPSLLLRFLWEVKEEMKNLNCKITVYAIANNGFYGGKQNNLALSMIRHFCIFADVKWGQGLGIGAGGMIGVAPIGKGPLKDIGLALDKFAFNIQNNISDDNFFVEPNFPKFLYKTAAHFQWRRQAKKNGLKLKDIYKRQ